MSLDTIQRQDLVEHARHAMQGEVYAIEQLFALVRRQAVEVVGKELN
jgi:hypothetical protein